MPVDTKQTVPVLIHVNPEDWKQFKALAGHRRASMRLRQMIRTHNAKLINAGNDTK